MTRIVSVTHNAVQRDTRAFKVGASLVRFGYESVVLEGEPSEMPSDRLPFELLAPPADGPAGTEDPAGTESPAESAGGGAGSRVPEGIRRRLRPLLQPLFLLTGILRENLALIRRLPRADAYYLHSFQQFPAAWLKAKRTRARLIYDAHDANWAVDAGAGEAELDSTTLRTLVLMDRICARRVDSFLTVGGGLAGLLERRLKRRPIVVRNCHDLRLDEPSPEDVRGVAGVPADAFLLVMTGGPKPGDTVEQALAALASLPGDVHLALVGRGQPGRSAAVAELGLQDRVHLLDAVPPTQVASFIRTADASPILYHALSDAYLHSLPNRFFHAVAAGLPILYPPLPEIKSLCDQYRLGVEVDPTDPDSIAAGVLALRDDREAAAGYAANVREARQQLSWEHEEATLSKLVERALSGREC